MTAAPEDAAPDNAALWRTVFQDGHPFLLKKHRLHRLLPRKPRCRLCLAPFAGVGGWLMRRRGQGPSPRNPNYCAACNRFLDAFPGGAEVEMPVVFVDVRDSSAAAAALPPAAFAARMAAFFDRVTAILADCDGFVVEFRGDCVAAVFPPGFIGPQASARALAAARALKGASDAAPGHVEGLGHGVGAHRGLLYIGTIGAAARRIESVTVFGEAANLAAGLAQAAAPGEALASAALMAAAGEPAGTPRAVSVKGHAGPLAATPL